MLWTILVILLVMWALGFGFGVGGNLIHILLLVAAVVLFSTLFKDGEPFSPWMRRRVRTPPPQDGDQVAHTSSFHKLFARPNAMNWDEIAGTWKQIKGKVKEKWDRLTENDLMDHCQQARPACGHPQTQIRRRTLTGAHTRDAFRFFSETFLGICMELAWRKHERFLSF